MLLRRGPVRGGQRVLRGKALVQTHRRRRDEALGAPPLVGRAAAVAVASRRGCQGGGVVARRLVGNKVEQVIARGREFERERERRGELEFERRGDFTDATDSLPTRRVVCGRRRGGGAVADVAGV